MTEGGPVDYRRAAKLFDALGSDVRLRIVDLVSAHKEMCTCELVDMLRMSQANISRHVKVLRDAGVLLDRKVGTMVVLRVDETAIGAGFRELAELVRGNHARSALEDVQARLRRRCESADGCDAAISSRG